MGWRGQEVVMEGSRWGGRRDEGKEVVRWRVEGRGGEWEGIWGEAQESELGGGGNRVHEEDEREEDEKGLDGDGMGNMNGRGGEWKLVGQGWEENWEWEG